MLSYHGKGIDDIVPRGRCPYDKLKKLLVNVKATLALMWGEEML